jgi:Putative transposase
MSCSAARRRYECCNHEPRTAAVSGKAALQSAANAVYAKPPFAGPEHVFRYLGRYTHRVALSNHRLVDFHDGRVSFTIKNYAQPGQRTVMHLDAVEFLRRFLLHVLPKGYTRIRHFGLCAGRNLHTKLEAARRLLTTLHHRYVLPISRSANKDNRPWWKRFLDRTGIDLLACTHCTSGFDLPRART